METTHASNLATRCYSIEPRTRKYVNGYGFLSLARNLCSKYGKQLLDTRLDALKIGCKRS